MRSEHRPREPSGISSKAKAARRNKLINFSPRRWPVAGGDALANESVDASRPPRARSRSSWADTHDRPKRPTGLGRPPSSNASAATSVRASASHGSCTLHARSAVLPHRDTLGEGEEMRHMGHSREGTGEDGRPRPCIVMGLPKARQRVHVLGHRGVERGRPGFGGLATGGAQGPRRSASSRAWGLGMLGYRPPAANVA